MLDDDNLLLAPRSMSVTCSVCCTNPSKYTCPRCHTKTCSAHCSSAHKTQKPCSALRDPATYVPLNKYGWGTMMDDYAFLEGVGHFVENQGTMIVRGGFSRGRASSSSSRARGRGRGAPESTGNNRGPMTKRDVLKMQLGFKSIRMDILPEGMHRQRLNMSRFDTRNKSISLTCEFTFHSPTSANSAAEKEMSTFTTHNNLYALTSNVAEIVGKQIARLSEQAAKSKTTASDKNTPPRSVNEKLPSWFEYYTHTTADQHRNKAHSHSHSQSSYPYRILLPEYPAKPLRKPIPAGSIPLPAVLTTSDSHGRPSHDILLRVHHLINETDTLQTALRGKAFLEFPSFIIIPVTKDLARAGIVLAEELDDDGTLQHFHTQKRKRVDEELIKKPIEALLGSYLSDEAKSDDDDRELREPNAIQLLGGYSSDEDEPPAVESDQSDGNEEEEEGGGLSHRQQSSRAITPRSASRWLQDGEKPDEDVDWGHDD